MRVLPIAMSAVLFACLSVAARAGTVTAFAFEATAFYYGDFSGSVSIDTTAGLIVGSDIVVPGMLDAAGEPYHITTVTPGTEQSYYDFTYPIESAVLTSSDGIAELDLRLTFYYPFLPQGYPFLTDFQGNAQVCGTDLNCNDFSEASTLEDYDLFEDGYSYVKGGAILGPVSEPISATPEPSSFVLLGTGAFGVAGMMRRLRR